MHKPTNRETISQNIRFYSLHNWRVEVMVGVTLLSIAALALAITGPTNTRRQEPRRFSNPAAQSPVPPTSNLLPDANLPPDFVPIGVVRINDELFEKLELRNAPEAATPGPGGGSAEVYDQNGHLVRRITAVERANLKWEIVEYVRLSAPVSSATIERITTPQH